MSLRFRLIVLLGAVLPLVAASAVPANAGSGGRRGDWPSWQGDTYGTRHNAAERTLTPATVG